MGCKGKSQGTSNPAVGVQIQILTYVQMVDPSWCVFKREPKGNRAGIGVFPVQVAPACVFARWLVLVFSPAEMRRVVCRLKAAVFAQKQMRGCNDDSWSVHGPYNPKTPKHVSGSGMELFEGKPKGAFGPTPAFCLALFASY